MTMKFFYSTGSCALASHIALEEAGADYEAMRISLKDGDQRKPEYLKLNPKGRVPVLVTDRGVLTENVAILAFVAQSHPAARLAPLDDPFAFAKMQAINSYLSSTVHVSHAHKGRGSRWVDDPDAIELLKKKVPQNMGDHFELIEREMLAGPWVMGDDYSVADAYLYTLATWLEGDSVDVKRFPRVHDHMNRMQQRPAVQRVLAAESA
jgi:glutathione S-transferase